jgi:hypothetical protein
METGRDERLVADAQDAIVAVEAQAHHTVDHAQERVLIRAEA